VQRVRDSLGHFFGAGRPRVDPQPRVCVCGLSQREQPFHLHAVGLEVSRARARVQDRSLKAALSADAESETLTLRFEGTQAGPAAPVDGQFVVQDATGGLAGLRGTGTFHDVGPAGTYTVRYHFDP